MTLPVIRLRVGTACCCIDRGSGRARCRPSVLTALISARTTSALAPARVQAPTLRVQEAGGRVTNFRGAPYTLADTSQTLASNGRLHDAMRRLLSDKVK